MFGTITLNSIKEENIYNVYDECPLSYVIDKYDKIADIEHIARVHQNLKQMNFDEPEKTSKEILEKKLGYDDIIFEDFILNNERSALVGYKTYHIKGLFSYQIYGMMEDVCIITGNHRNLDHLWSTIYYCDRDNPFFERSLIVAAKYANVPMFTQVFYGYLFYNTLNGTSSITRECLYALFEMNKKYGRELKNLLDEYLKLDYLRYWNMIESEIKSERETISNEDDYDAENEEDYSEKAMTNIKNLLNSKFKETSGFDMTIEEFTKDNKRIFKESIQKI